MFSRRHLEPLMRHSASDSSPILSLYLDVDQARPVNRNRGIETAARAMLSSLREQDVADPAQLDEDIRRVEDFLGGYEPSGRSLVLFCDASADLLWQRTFPVPLPPDVRYRPDPHLRPLLETLDEHERYGVVLLDRQQARLFTVFFGGIEEHREAFAPLSVKATRTTGTDHIFSEKRFHRRAVEHAHLHIKQVASMLRKLQRERGFDQLVIAGPLPATSELQRLLPRALSDRVAAVLKLPIDTSENGILRQVTDLQDRREREREAALVEDLFEAAARGRQAVLGIQPTLEALRELRVLRILYVSDGPIEGGICRRCGTLSRRARGQCSFCRVPLGRVHDLVGRMARAVVESGGRLDRLRHPEAVRRLAPHSTGAFLRF
ncbi:MAG: hypothetical protein ACE5JH_04495 [Acidobacteriota bacterium]